MTDDTTKSTDTTYLLEEGMTINGKWEILNFIAKGGKGEVYLARQLNLALPGLAIKLPIGMMVL